LKQGLFLDRDGTLIRPEPYLADPDKVVLLPGAAAALRVLKELGFLLILVSNQAGIRRGLIDPDQAARVHQRFTDLLAQEELTLDGVYYCPHAPWDACACRKPAPGMLLRAARELAVDLGRSFLVGDAESDVGAALAAGVTPIRFRPGEPECSNPSRGWSEVLIRIQSRI